MIQADFKAKLCKVNAKFNAENAWKLYETWYYSPICKESGSYKNWGSVAQLQKKRQLSRRSVVLVPYPELYTLFFL